MASGTEQISAFAVYKNKRKNSEQPINSKKKIKHSSREILTPQNQDLKAKKTKIKVTLKKKRTVESKCTSNVAKKKVIIVPKESILKSMKKKNKTKNLNKRKPVISEDLKKRESTSTNHIVKEQNLTQEILKCEQNYNLTNPIKNSINQLEWLIHPVKNMHFFRNNWEKRWMHIKRDKPSYYSSLVSISLLDSILREKDVLYTKNIDITKYFNGKRVTLNRSGRAVPLVVWEYYINGCSVRMLNPQTFLDGIHEISANLQEYFGCFVGSNLYLTPPNSQGFAPHYDDIEAFVLQIEGKKRWRLYESPENEVLPRYSSKDFMQSELAEPFLDVIVEAGDLLYFPRGTIHQAQTLKDTHSLHITLSIYQKNSWCDFFEKLLPQTLERVTETDSRFRKGLPIGFLSRFGFAYKGTHNLRREIYNLRTKTKNYIKSLLTKLIDNIDVDSAADLMAKQHIHDFLPPVLTWSDRECSTLEAGKIKITKREEFIFKNYVRIKDSTKIRLLNWHCIRLIKEDDKYKIYISTENSKEYHEWDLQFLEIDKDFIPAVKKIIKRYPEFIYVRDLPLKDKDDRICLVTNLWDRGLVVTNISLRVNSLRKKMIGDAYVICKHKVQQKNLLTSRNRGNAKVMYMLRSKYISSM